MPIYFIKRKPILIGVGGAVLNGEEKMFPSEKKFADLLTKQKRKWQYPAPRFKVGNTTYTPDFYLPKEDLYIEVVNYLSSYRNNESKYRKFKQIYPHIHFIIVKVNGEKFILPKPKEPKGIMICFPIKKELKDALTGLSDMDKRSQTYHLERALSNYFKIKLGNRLNKKG